jgi:hypothetical protein
MEGKWITRDEGGDDRLLYFCISGGHVDDAHDGWFEAIKCGSFGTNINGKDFCLIYDSPDGMWKTGIWDQSDPKYLNANEEKLFKAAFKRWGKTGRRLFVKIFFEDMKWKK